MSARCCMWGTLTSLLALSVFTSPIDRHAYRPAIARQAALGDPAPSGESLYQLGSVWTTDGGNQVRFGELKGYTRVLAMMFTLAYAVPLFWAEHVVGGIFGRRILPESAITAALSLAVLGVGCIWLGMRVAQAFHWVPEINKDVASDPSRWAYLRVIFVVGTLVKIFVPITARTVICTFRSVTFWCTLLFANRVRLSSCSNARTSV